MEELNNTKIKFNEQYKSYFDYKYDYIKQQISDYLNCKKVIISDCDGILTDGRSYFSNNKKYLKSYGSYDKEMINLFLRLNWKFIFVSHDDPDGLSITGNRIKDLQNKFNVNDDKIKFIPANPEERFNIVKDFINDKYLTFFIGDSLSDIPALSKAYFSGTTNNAPIRVKEYCDFISKLNGGQGGFADILDLMQYKIEKYGFNFKI